MEDVVIPIDRIYVPAKRRSEIDEANVAALAESILEEGQQTAIRVREDGERYVLVHGLHRLEACRALGEETIVAIVVRAMQH